MIMLAVLAIEGTAILYALNSNFGKNNVVTVYILESIVLFTILFAYRKKYKVERNNKIGDYIKCVTIDCLPIWILIGILYADYCEKIEIVKTIYNESYTFHSIERALNFINVRIREELFFRVFLIDYNITKKEKVSFSQILFYSFCFGLVHIVNITYMDMVSVIVQIIIASIMGLIYCILYYCRGRSLLLVAFMHFIYDYIVSIQSLASSTIGDFRLNMLAWCGKEFYIVAKYIDSSICLAMIILIIEVIFVVVIWKKDQKRICNASNI